MEIIVNGEPVTVGCDGVTYSEIMRLAGIEPPRVPSVTFRYRSGVGGSLALGGKLSVQPGMVVNVISTDGA